MDGDTIENTTVIHGTGVESPQSWKIQKSTVGYLHQHHENIGQSLRTSLIHELSPEVSDAEMTYSDSSEEEEEEGDNVSAPYVDVMTNIEKLSQDTDLPTKMQAAMSVRRDISKSSVTRIDEYISLGLIPVLLQSIEPSKEMIIQYEALWALTNIAAGTSHHTSEVVKAGAVPRLIKILQSPHINVRGQAIWALGNIIGESGEYRELVMHYGIVRALVDACLHYDNADYTRNISWAILNLVRCDSPAFTESSLKLILPLVQQFVCHKDPQIVADGLWSYVYLTTSSGGTSLQVLMDNIDLKYIINLLKVPDIVQDKGDEESGWSKLIFWFTSAVRTEEVPPPSAVCDEKVDPWENQRIAIRIISNISASSDIKICNQLLHCELIRYMKGTLTSNDGIVLKKALFSLSNVLRTPASVQLVINEGVLPLVTQHIWSEEPSHMRVNIEAAWVLDALLLQANKEHLQLLLCSGVIPKLCGLLQSPNEKAIHLAAGNISNYLASLEADTSEAINQIADCGGLVTLEKLQSHSNSDIQRIVGSIMCRHLSGYTSELMA